MATLRRRLAGLAFFLVIIAFIGGSILKYQGHFSNAEDVTLRTDSAGNSLTEHADVKARGMVVGTVSAVNPSPDGQVDVVLALQPDKLHLLPRGTTARILPKTLFGERYVALEVPMEPTTTATLAAGDEIRTADAGNAKEVQDFFDRLLPLLKAVPPQDLNVTLTSISQALAGRGQELGETIKRLDAIFSEVNDHTDDLQATLRGLASFSTTYSDALPSIINGLDNLRVTGNTLNERQGDLAALISTLGVAADDTTSFLRTNRTDLITIFTGTEEMLAGLARQSPVFGCTFKNFAGLIAESRRIVGEGTPNPGVRVNLQFVNPRGRYLPNQDEPRMFDYARGPVCYTPAKNGRPFPQYPGGGLADGSYQVPSRNPGPRTIPQMPAAQFSALPAGKAKSDPWADPVYRAQLQMIYGGASGVAPEQVPSWVTLIGASRLRGAQVNMR
ncbi:Mce family protein [Gordonia araii NBRC 100433]|uniref:Mce family protein n=1 Tax=Gordonia araii NBRC 100433 TaxID=1073574 RepID=G7H7H3_9ACTN|nr:MCE family protein [Gordonia araii]NNG98481.1 MCE family protein [Gordonia araii NBRC 100433]GAB11798.1 Mce family protein [Gordonia araii NBRC 100433]